MIQKQRRTGRKTTIQDDRGMVFYMTEMGVGLAQPTSWPAPPARYIRAGWISPSSAHRLTKSLYTNSAPTAITPWSQTQNPTSGLSPLSAAPGIPPPQSSAPSLFEQTRPFLFSVPALTKAGVSKACLYTAVDTSSPCCLSQPGPSAAVLS